MHATNVKTTTHMVIIVLLICAQLTSIAAEHSQYSSVRRGAQAMDDDRYYFRTFVSEGSASSPKSKGKSKSSSQSKGKSSKGPKGKGEKGKREYYSTDGSKKQKLEK